MAGPHAAHLGARHDQRHHAGLDAAGACASAIIGLRAAAVVGRAGERRRHHLRAHLVLPAAGLSARCRHAHPQPAALGQRHGGAGRHPRPAARRADRPMRRPIRIGKGGIRFDRRDVPLRQSSAAALPGLLGRRSAPGERVGLVGPFGFRQDDLRQADPAALRRERAARS